MDPLKLENQLCFPLYAASKEVIRRYRTLLQEVDLTYTQYITMMVLWQNGCISVKQLGDKLYLDSGTLTPLLKSLETKGFLTRSRSKEDERVLLVHLTAKGKDLRNQCVSIPAQLFSCVDLTPDEAQQLYRLLYKILQK